ncbi:MAG: fumarate hydratase [Oscillospiraceae bacterium]|nr:fumarate hydratase [Oscillospiraceae bacterium]
MREIDAKIITQKIKEAFIEANLTLSDNLVSCIKDSVKSENFILAKNILQKLDENIKLAQKLNIPVCQDTGMAVLFVNIGQDVHIINGFLKDAVNQGVREAYIDGDLRLSIVKDPLRRENTNDNTPAIIHTNIIPGDKIEIICVPKGFGSENASRIKMFEPSANEEDIIDFIVETVKLAGGNPCPPVIVGVGIGGDFEYSAVLAKLALTREIGESNPDGFYKKIEENALEKINKTNVGPQGFGGKTTAFAVNIETFPTHIAGLPVAVNICCHVYRHKKVVI